MRRSRFAWREGLDEQRTCARAQCIPQKEFYPLRCVRIMRSIYICVIIQRGQTSGNTPVLPLVVRLSLANISPVLEHHEDTE